MLKLLEQLWRLNSECRFCQLVVSVCPPDYRVINIPNVALQRAVARRLSLYPKGRPTNQLKTGQHELLVVLNHAMYLHSHQQLGALLVASAKAVGIERYWLTYDHPDTAIVEGLQKQLDFEIYPCPQEWPQYQLKHEP